MLTVASSKRIATPASSSVPKRQEDASTTPSASPATTTRRRLARQIDIVERERTIELSFQAPCHSIEQLRFEAVGTAVTVEARWDDEAEAGPVLFARKHTFVLDIPIEFERLNATFDNGIVTLSIPKLRT